MVGNDLREDNTSEFKVTMLTGHKALENINEALAMVRTDVKRVDQALAELSEEKTANTRGQGQIVAELAKLRLQALERSALSEQLSVADRQVQQLLAQRENASAEIKERIVASEQSLEALEQQREACANDCAAQAEQVLAKESHVQKLLDGNQDYQAQNLRARQDDAIADEAHEKAELADADRQQKGMAYERDSLFMYLWDLGYGTSRYRAGSLIRNLDAWVARLCDFEPARRNYQLLLEIPKHLAKHAQTVAEKASASAKSLELMETKVARDEGLYPLQKVLKSFEHKLVECEKEIEQAERDHSELLAENARFSAGEDDYTLQAIKLLNQALASSRIDQLFRLVNQTPSRDDDALAEQLVQLQEQQSELDAELVVQRSAYTKQLEQLKELEQVRRSFRQRRFDDRRSGFANGPMLASVLQGFLRGAVHGADLWNVYQRAQRHQDVGAWPDFGSGGLGQRRNPKRTGPWHWPGGRGFRLPGGIGSRARNRPSGGFRTGGGF